MHKTHHIFSPTIDIKYYNAMIDEQNFFGQPVKNDMRTYDNIRKLQLVKIILILKNITS